MITSVMCSVDCRLGDFHFSINIFLHFSKFFIFNYHLGGKKSLVGKFHTYLR